MIAFSVAVVSVILESVFSVDRQTAPFPGHQKPEANDDSLEWQRFSRAGSGQGDFQAASGPSEALISTEIAPPYLQSCQQLTLNERLIHQHILFLCESASGNLQEKGRITKESLISSHNLEFINFFCFSWKQLCDSFTERERVWF